MQFKYKKFLHEKSGVALEEIREALSLLPLRIYQKDMYQRILPDADILALHLAKGAYLWSEDKDFEKVTPPLRLLKTKDFF